MSNLSQTAANVGVGNTGQPEIVQVGESVTQGQPGYLDASAGKWYRAQATSTKHAAKAIFLTPAATDGYAVIRRNGKVNLGATLAVGETYVVSATVGAICPIADLVSTDYVTILGVASSTSLLELAPQTAGVAKA